MEDFQFWNGIDLMLWIWKQEDRGRLSVDEQLKLLDCKDQEKKLAELEMELSATKSQGFRPMIELSGNASTGFGGKLLAVVGIMTTFGTRSRRESIRKTWPEGETFFFFFVYFLVCFFPISLSPFSLSLAPFHS
jgi:hypothetical protein